MDNEESKENELENRFKKRLWWTVSIGLIAIIGLWSINFFYGFKGEFGDKFGVINSLFSGLAFAGIIITILMQRHELELQRKELESTRKVFKKQSRIMTHQQNDNTFFNLLENHRQLVQSFTKGEIKFDGSGSLTSNNWKTYTDAVSGYDVLKQIADSWKKYFEAYSHSYQSKLITDLSLQEYQGPFGLINSDLITFTFTRELLHLHKFINQRFKSDEVQKFYRETVLLSLTDQEKFIFEAMYELFPSERNDVALTPSYYLDHHFIDFKSCQLPEFEIEYKNDSTSVEIYKLFVKHWAHLIKSEFIIYENHLPHEIKIKECLPAILEETDEYRKGVFYLLNCLDASFLHDWRSQSACYVESNKFALLLQLEHKDELFSILFNIDFSFSERVTADNIRSVELSNVRIGYLSHDFAQSLLGLKSN
jgi:hypothetical protein